MTRRRPICGVGTKAMMGTFGLYLASCLTVLPFRLMAMMRSESVWLAMLTAAMQMDSRLVALLRMASDISLRLWPMLENPHRLSRASSAWLTMVFMVLALSSGYCPLADSPESMTQSDPSRTAFPTSVTSARVGRGLRCMLSSIWVATITGFPARLHSRTIFFWRMRSSAKGISTPRSPLATMIPSLSARISSKLSTPSLFSILLTMAGLTISWSLAMSPSCLAWLMHLSMYALTDLTSPALRTKLAATMSISFDLMPQRMSSLSFSVMEGSCRVVLGMLTPLTDPSSPPFETVQTTSQYGSPLASWRSELIFFTSRPISPSSSRMQEPGWTVLPIC
mmetsp:Transcript_27355/g.51872  ORF Transcript_27355/g.51872 Transcript_27355/m.51872 type:complete len:337 (+) Transcript_27355:278-1288(+)